MGTRSWPSISVIVPARNEQEHIGSCLKSILEGDYPRDRLEVIVVDGESDDRTRELALAYSNQYPCVKVIDNPARVVPHAMNVGIRAAQGEIIVRMDAHARYQPDYLPQLITWMERLSADNVGGSWDTRPANGTLQAIAVALVLSHPFGVGSAQYRTGGTDVPTEVDTVPFGCYRREMFDRIGLYDERFVRNQDDELNARLKDAGGRIFLVPQIRIEYVARESLTKMSRMLYQYGYFKPLVAIKLGRPATLRQLAPPCFVAMVFGLPLLAPMSSSVASLWLALCAIYLAANLAASAGLAFRRGWQLLPLLCVTFALAHVAYGVGYLRGVLDFGLLRRHLNKREKEVPLSR